MVKELPEAAASSLDAIGLSVVSRGPHECSAWEFGLEDVKNPLSEKLGGGAGAAAVGGRRGGGGRMVVSLMGLLTGLSNLGGLRGFGGEDLVGLRPPGDEPASNWGCGREGGGRNWG